MPLAKLFAMVWRNVLRSRQHTALSAFGIVVGIASFVFFLGLSSGVERVVLGEMFPLERVTVIAPKASFLGQDLRKQLDDEVVEAIRARPEVAQVVPRMSLAFPATGQAWFEGHSIHFEVGGFADGISAEFVADEPFAEAFNAWSASEQAGEAEPRDLPRCGPPPNFACEDSARYYCDRRARVCRHRVPVLVSPMLLELYNGQFAKSHGLPVIGQFEQFLAMRGGVGKLRFFIGLGETMVAGSNLRIDASKRRQVEGMLVGISDKAMSIGMTVPIEYVRAWNREFMGPEAASRYSSIEVRLRDKDEVAPFAAWLQSELDLRLEDSNGERFATAIFIVTSLFVLISFVIVAISAINIAHNFFMQVSERRREIGLWRAVGASRHDIQFIILGEAATIGILGGVIGVILAVTLATGIDAAAAAWLPPFPFKPDSYFVFDPAVLLGGLGFAVCFCILGGFLPARQAAAMAPAQVLAQP